MQGWAQPGVAAVVDASSDATAALNMTPLEWNKGCAAWLVEDPSLVKGLAAGLGLAAGAALEAAIRHCEAGEGASACAAFPSAADDGPQGLLSPAEAAAFAEAVPGQHQAWKLRFPVTALVRSQKRASEMQRRVEPCPCHFPQVTAAHFRQKLQRRLPLG